MKNLGFYFIFISIVVFGSCDSTQIECLRASSKNVSELRDLRDFKGIVFNHVGDLILSQGPEYSFLINGPVNVLESTTTTIENEILVIGSEHCFNGDYKMTIEITAPEYELINLTGIGEIQTVGNIEGEIIQMELVGIGGIEADIVADTLYTRVSGTGDISYTGEVVKHQLLNAGEITLNAYSLSTKETLIDISGTGDCQVTVSDLLTVIISGTGSVFYQGNPEIDREISGTGEIIDSN